MMGKCKKRIATQLWRMEAQAQARHTGKVLAIEELEASVQRMLCGAQSARNALSTRQHSTIMKDIPGQLEELWKHQPSVLVVCADGYGCHRARTLAAILQAYYEQRGFNSKGPFRSTCEGWRIRMCYMQGCKPTITETQQMYAAIGDEW